MPLAAQTAEQERVVPTTQGRLTPAGQEQQGNVTMRFADLRARVTRQVDAVRRNDMQVKALDCPVHACFQPLAPDHRRGYEDCRVNAYYGHCGA
jgi:hypothetical protein